jgi:hypothetical protein
VQCRGRCGDRAGRPTGNQERALSRGEAALSAAIVFIVALGIRWYAASLVVFPKPEDTAYYVDVARNLLAGRGLISDALWSYQTPPLVVPREAFEVWLPLPTFAAALPMALFGSTFAAAQVSSVLIGSVVPVLAWRLAADVAEERRLPPGRARTFAIGTGLTAAVSLPLILHSTLPDSTMPFAALSLAACLLITRICSATTRPTRQLVALGAVLALAALTRNEAAWLALAWVVVAVRLPVTRPERLDLILIPAAVALAMFAPWMVRDWLAFGTPLPGQALTNALSIEGTDIFAWNDPPTLARYLAAGPGRLIEMRVTGVGHNLFDVLLLPGAPLSFIGLIGLPWIVRTRALQPLLLVSAVIFLVTGLLFPVSTTWGTFLHAAGAIHVLLIVSALLALDRVIVAIGRRRGWTRPVAWFAPALTVSGALLFSVVILPTFGGASVATARQFAALDQQMAASGLPIDRSGPIITDAPIWMPYTGGGTGLALPFESPASVLDLAHRFHASIVVVASANQPFPATLAAGGAGSECFQAVEIGRPADPAFARALEGTSVYRVVCP